MLKVAGALVTMAVFGVPAVLALLFDSLLSREDRKMATIKRNKLTVTLTKYVIRCTRQERSGELVELLAITEWLTVCDLRIAEKLAREALGIPRLSRNMRVTYDRAGSATFTIPTHVIAESELAIIE